MYRRVCRSARPPSRANSRWPVAALAALLVLAGAPLGAQAQARGVLTGTVLDDATGAPIPRVTVLVVGTTRGTLTDDRGRFVIGDVVQDTREPAFEGLWDIAVSPSPLVDQFRVYVETPGEPSALSGWYARDRASATLEGMVGTRTNGRVVLEFLANQAAVDTVGVFSGEQRGDSLIGTFNGVTGRVVFLKRPSQSG